MEFFNNAKDLFLKGITPAMKKQYSPFLGAALLYMPNFKIIGLNDGSKFGEIEGSDGRFQIKLSFNRNNKKIDELSTQIFFFLDDETLKTVQTNKKLTEFISYEDYKKIRNISKQSFSNISKAMGSNWLVHHYLELKSKRSYVRYLLEPENKLKIERLNQLKQSGILNIKNPIHRPYLGPIDNKINTNYILDSQFKGIDPFKRKDVVNGLSYNSFDRILEQAKYRHLNNYKFMDVWYLKLTVSSNNNIVFEDVQLVNGMSESDLHEDDISFFSEVMGIMFERWSEFKLLF
jgi:hypothetical protein